MSLAPVTILKQNLLQTLGRVKNRSKAKTHDSTYFQEHSSQSEAAGSFNSVGVRSSVKLHKDYKNILVKYYCANSSNIVEDSPETANLEYISDAGVMSHWRDYEKLAVYTFLSHQSLMPFYRRNNATVHVPMIPQVGIFRSGLWENAEVVLLPLQVSQHYGIYYAYTADTDEIGTKAAFPFRQNWFTY